MMTQNQYAQYNTSRILTASPAELTLMLYEGAIKFCNIAIIAIEHKDMEKAHINIVKAENIIEEFRSTLDRSIKVSEDFDRVYVYLLDRLFTANVEKNTEVLEEVVVHLRSMRDTWKQVMEQNKIKKHA